MTRQEIISLAFKVKEHPNDDHDFATYLYYAVGLIKREPDSGATFAAAQLVKAIEEVTDVTILSDRAQRRIDMILEAEKKRMATSLQTLAKAYEIRDRQMEERFLQRRERV